jgi:hypothetical protein
MAKGKTNKKSKPVKTVASRVVRLDHYLPSELQSHPLNWRTHGDDQKGAMDGLLRENGFVKPADVYIPQATDKLVTEGIVVGGELRKLKADVPCVMDGHLRRERVPADFKIPCNVTDLNEAEALKYLATADPLSAMADQSDENLVAVLGLIDSDDRYVQAMLSELVQLDGSEGGDEEEEDDEPGATDKYQIVINCASEEQQREMVAELTERGLDFRALVA